MGSNVVVVVYVIVVFATAWTDGKAAAVNALLATNSALLLVAKKYAPVMDIAIAGNAGSYNISLTHRAVYFNRFS